MGAKKTNWVRTRESLTTAFREFPTVTACVLFRRKNSATINQLRTNAKDEWDIFNEVAASYERTLFEQDNPQHADHDEHPANLDLHVNGLGDREKHDQ
jgi:hypothetical protein